MSHGIDFPQTGAGRSGLYSSSSSRVMLDYAGTQAAQVT